MPEVSRFLGIIISFYYDEHNPPHFHVKYNEHRDELFEDWELAQQGKEPKKIAPLT